MTGNARTSWISRRRIPLIAGITTFLLLIGGGGAWAYWTATVSATGTLSTQTASVAHASFPSLSATYLPSSLTSTGSFTVTNTGQIAGTATVQISASGAFAQGLPIRIWPVASASSCTAAATVPGTALSGSWGSPPALTPSLAAGASIIYCVRTTITDWTALTSPTGAQSVSPAINVSLNAAGWIATAPSATNTQQTAGMYPLAPNFFDPGLSRWFTVRAKAANGICLDTNGSGGTGTSVISWSCSNSSNQRWEFIPVSGTNQSLVTIRPRHAMGTRINSTAAGVQQVLTYNAASTLQQWYVQQIDSTTFQLVNASTGRCLNLRNTSDNSNMSTVTCDTATARLTFTREPLTFTNNALTGITIGFGSEAPGVVRVQRWTGSAWTTVATTASNATSVTFSRANITNNTTATFRIINANNVVVWDNIQISVSGLGLIAEAVSGIG